MCLHLHRPCVYTYREASKRVVGPRAVQYLILGAKSRAALMGSYMVRLDDVQQVAASVLTHRIITTFAAQAEGIDARQIVHRLIEETTPEA